MTAEHNAHAVTENGWEEEWKPIPGYPDYEVSNMGNVRSFLRKGNHKARRNQDAKLLKACNRRGDRTACVAGNGKGYNHIGIHQLVMLAFVGPCPDGLEVAHLNGKRDDNRLSNLKYCTHLENESHKVAHGTLGIGEQNSIAKLVGWQVAEIRYLAEQGVPQDKIAALFDVSAGAVKDIVSGRNWPHIESRTLAPAVARQLQAARERERELEKLAYIGDHHFPDLTWKARCYEEIAERDRLRAEVERLRQAVEFMRTERGG